MPELFVITLGCFAAAYINAAFSVGGGYVILASASYTFPITVAVQLHPALAMMSLVTRIAMFRKDTDWSIARFFILGAVVGVIAGSQVLISVNEGWVSLILGGLILLLLWLPSVRLNLPNAPTFTAVGLIHAFISTFLAIGSVLQSTILRTGLTRVQIIGTLATCLFTMCLMKVASYQLHGFNYMDYFWHILCASIAGIAGVWAGKYSGRWVSEALFINVYRLAMSLFACSLMYKGMVVLSG